MTLRDLPDYTRQMVIRYEGGFVGLEELATRLGFIGPWDLRGNVILMEDFESELTEWEDMSDAGCSTARSSRHKFSGDWSLKLYSTGTGNLRPQICRLIHFPGTSKYALFGRFYLDASLVGFYFDLALASADGSYNGRVRYNLETTTLDVYTTGAAYKTVDASLDLSAAVPAWFPVLVTFDLEIGYYDKLYFADTEYDISTVPLYSEAGVATPYGQIWVGGVGKIGGSPFTFYVDDIIVLKNVP